MVMTVGAINKFGDESQAQTEEADETARREKSKNVMYRPSEKTGGEKPIDLIRATRPIIIVDEPQSVEGGLDGKGKRAMERMNPLCNCHRSLQNVPPAVESKCTTPGRWFSRLGGLPLARTARFFLKWHAATACLGCSP
jgi:hypothetical protein